MTQSEMGEKTGVSRVTFSNIESGKRDGTRRFWLNLQKAFNISDSEMWQLQQLESEDTDE